MSRFSTQHLENPGEAHWKAVERLLVFLYADKKHWQLKMQTPKEMRPMDVVDSAFAINLILPKVQVHISELLEDAPW